LSGILPGLWLALLTAGLAAALRRWWDPVPGRVLALFAAVLLALFAPALFGGRVLLPLDILTRHPPFQGLAMPAARGNPGNPLQRDLVTQIVPWQLEVRAAFARGEWPLWNDHAGAGMPLLGDPQSQSLQPLVLLAAPLPIAQAVGVTAALRVLVPLIFLFLFLRRQGAGEPAACAGSLAYGLCGFQLLGLGWPSANTAALLPPLLYALAISDDRGARRDFLLLVLATASVLLAGHPETILYAGLAAGGLAAARLLARPRGSRRSLFLRWSAAGLLAGCLAAPALAPAATYLPQGHRTWMMERRNATLTRDTRGPLADIGKENGGSLRQRLVPMVAPNAYGNDRFGAYWGGTNINEDAAGYAGGAALLAALLACAPGARRFREERLFLGLAAVALLVVVRPPGLAWLLIRIPGLKQSSTFHHRILLLLALALAVLAAYTAERWQRGEIRRRAVLSVAALLAGLSLWGTLGATATAAPLRPDALLTLRLSSLALHLAVLGAAAWLLARPRRPAAAWGLAALVAAELILLHRPANPALPAALFYPRTAALDFLRDHLRLSPGGARVAGVASALPANLAGVYGFADARISNPSKPSLYTLAMQPVSRSVRNIEDVFEPREHPLYQLLGVRYVITPPLRRGAARHLHPVFRDESAWIFEQPAPLPRLFLPAAVDSAATPGTAWTAWLAANPSFAARSLLQEIPGGAASWSAGSSPWQETELWIDRLEPERLGAEALLHQERPLASSLYQDGGWRLLLDGRPRSTLLANGPFVAAWLPAGRHRIDLLYRPPGFAAGCLLAALAVAALCLWLTPPPRWRG